MATNIPGLPAATSPSLPPQNSNSTDDPEQLGYLLELKFGGIAFPAISFTENGGQDLAIHKYPNLDSARVENTGRNPSVYTCRAVLTNNIYPNSRETWKAGTLFPRVFELLMNILYDSTGYHILQHPFLGERNVMTVKWDYSFIGKGPRDGVYLDMSWIETIGDDDLNSTISQPNSLAEMQNVGTSIDTEYTSTALTPFNPPNLTLGQFFSKISGLVKNFVSFPEQTLTAINAQIIQVNSSLQGAGAAIATSLPHLQQTGTAIVNQNKGLILHGPISNAYYYNKAVETPVFNYSSTALEKVYHTTYALNNNSSSNASEFISNVIVFTQAMILYYSSINRVETANIKLYLFQLLRALQSASSTLFDNNRNYKVNTYAVIVPTTLISIAKVLNNSIDQLLQLNSKLNKLYIVPEGTIIRYYQG